MRFGSVCSGIESASVAWHPLGWKADWFAEVDRAASDVLAYRFPDVPNLGDMTLLAAKVRAREITAPDILVGGTPCFTAGHMVLLDRGYVPIEDVLPGDVAVTHEGRLRRVARVGSKVAEVGRLDMVGRPEGIVCTANHRFLARHWRNQSTKRDGEYCRIERISEPEWRDASAMVGYQWLTRTTYHVEPPTSWPERLSQSEAMLIAGLYLGDGWTRQWFNTKKKCVVLGVNEDKYATITDLLPEIGHSTSFERTVIKLTLHNTSLANWLEGNFGRLSGGKTLPAWVLAHPLREKLLQGYRLTDGTAQENGKWTANSISRSLSFGIASLADTLGYSTSIREVETPDTTVIEGRTVNQNDYWSAQAFPLDMSRKSRVAGSHILRGCQKWSELGLATVYDIEVEEDHSFVLDGAIVHNCQSFSVAGMRGGLSDSRGQLTIAFIDLADAIDEIRVADGLPPVIIVWENVPGVLNHADNPLGCFLAGLAGDDDALEPGPRPEPGRSAAYWAWDKKSGVHRPKWPNAGCAAGPQRAAAWRVIDAQYVGLAQRRRRVFVVASAREGFDPAAVLLEFEGVRRDSAPSREAGEGITHPVAPCLTSSGRGVERTGDTRGQDAVVAVIDDGVPGRLRGPAELMPGEAAVSPCWDGRDVSQTLDAVLYKGQTMPEKNRFPAVLQPVDPTLYSIMPMNSGRDFKAREVPVTQPLMAGGPVGGNQGGDYVLQLIAFGSKDYGADASVGDTPTLRAGGHADSHANAGVPPAVAYAIQERAISENPASGPDGVGVRSDDCAYTLEARQVPQAVCVTGSVTHTLKAEGFDASEDGTGRGQPIVPAMAFQERGRANGRSLEINGDLAYALTAPVGGGRAQERNILDGHQMAVRRLMPVECERLQGFPDNWTLVPTGPKGKPAADGPRYKQCGNSMATNVMFWIGQRIAAALGHNGGPAIDDDFERLLGDDFEALLG